MSKASRWCRVLTMAARAIATFVLAGIAAWGAMALWYQAPGGIVGKVALVVVWLGLLGTASWCLWRRRPAMAVLVALPTWLVMLLWWNALPASNDRDWLPELSRLPAAAVTGSQVTIDNVRDFRWRSETDFDERWEQRDYDLDRLASVDMLLVYWGRPSIAHLIVSFGFDDGRHLAFSVEVRRKRGEPFSEIGGFFKQFELAIVAADERDVVALRTDARVPREEVFLYRIALDASKRRALFLAYVDEIQSLSRKPRFYNTITANCTTLVYHMVRGITGGLPLDPSLLLSGRLPGYLGELGALDRRFPLDELARLGHVNGRGDVTQSSVDYSAAIRRGIPELPTAGE